MPTVKTVFEINGEHFTVEGAGQETVKAALKKWKKQVVRLVGFLIDDVFHKADLN